MPAGLDWLAANLGCIQYKARRLARHDDNLFDELVSYAAERAEDVARTWREDGGAGFNHHMRVGLGWYISKQVKNRNRVGRINGHAALSLSKGPLTGANSGEDKTDDSNVTIAASLAIDTNQQELIEDQDHARYIMEGLPVQYKLAIALIVVEGCTEQKVAGLMGISQRYVSKLYHEALDYARELGDDSSDTRRIDQLISEIRAAT